MFDADCFRVVDESVERMPDARHRWWSQLKNAVRSMQRQREGAQVSKVQTKRIAARMRSAITTHLPKVAERLCGQWCRLPGYFLVASLTTDHLVRRLAR